MVAPNLTNLKPMSMELDAFVQGGLLQDVDVEIVEIQFCAWDYGQSGIVSEDVLAVKCILQKLGEDGKPLTDSEGKPENPVEQYWSAGGKYADVLISDDLYFCYPTENKSALTKGSNWYVFLSSLYKRGMPPGWMASGSLAVLKGLRFHLVREAAPKREGITGGRRTDRDPTIPVCGSILPPMLWGGTAAASTRSRASHTSRAANGAPATATATQPSQAGPQAVPQTPPVGDAGLDEIAVRFLREVLTTAPNQTMENTTAVKVAVFRALIKDKTVSADTRNAIGKLCEDTAWLESHGAMLLDGTVVLV